MCDNQNQQQQHPSLLKKIELIRSKFEEELLQNNSKYHPIDVERVRKEQWQVERFLLDETNEDEAFDALCKSLQWKKSYGIHDRNDKTFAKEFWELSSVEICGHDHQGRLIQWEAYRNQRKFKELDQIVQQFIAHNIERLDRAAGRQGFILVSDLGGAGVSNIDLDLIRFKLSTIEHYPGGLQQLLIVDLPWLLNSLMTLIITFMSAKLRKMVVYCKKNELKNYIDEQYILSRLNGKREKRCFPSDLLPMDQMMAEMDLNEKFIDHFYKTFKLSRTTVTNA